MGLVYRGLYNLGGLYLGGIYSEFYGILNKSYRLSAIFGSAPHSNKHRRLTSVPCIKMTQVCCTFEWFFENSYLQDAVIQQIEAILKAVYFTKRYHLAGSSNEIILLSLSK